MPQGSHRLGDYLLAERIGEGGMAEVFRAELQEAGSGTGPAGTVVIKRIRPELFRQPEFPIFRAMFLNEARLVKRLSHPNLARVFALHEVTDAATGATVPFIVGEFVKGRELWVLMRVATRGFSGGNVPPAIAAYIIREVARGLGHAHGHADEATGKPAPIIHRDVSPENVMISDTGQVKVIDFGVAKAIGGFGPQTRTGIIKGKLAYMAPEQVSQRAVPATDVFGAGIVLYELLTGRRLFGGQNEFLVVQRVLKAVIPPPSTRVRVPRELDEIVMRALERDLRRRYRDGNALADALTDVLERLPELRGTGAESLVEWVQEVEGRDRPGAQRPSEGESDLHVDVDRAIQAIEGEVRSATINLTSDDLIFGPIDGPVDPSVHAAVTQAMKTLTPNMLHRSQEPTQPPAAPRLPGVDLSDPGPASEPGAPAPSAVSSPDNPRLQVPVGPTGSSSPDNPRLQVAVGPTGSSSPNNPRLQVPISPTGSSSPNNPRLQVPINPAAVSPVSSPGLQGQGIPGPGALAPYPSSASHPAQVPSVPMGRHPREDHSRETTTTIVHPDQGVPLWAKMVIAGLIALVLVLLYLLWLQSHGGRGPGDLF